MNNRAAAAFNMNKGNTASAPPGNPSCVKRNRRQVNQFVDGDGKDLKINSTCTANTQAFYFYSA
jgi:hypothetical protein